MPAIPLFVNNIRLRSGTRTLRLRDLTPRTALYTFTVTTSHFSGRSNKPRLPLFACRPHFHAHVYLTLAFPLLYRILLLLRDCTPAFTRSRLAVLFLTTTLHALPQFKFTWWLPPAHCTRCPAHRLWRYLRRQHRRIRRLMPYLIPTALSRRWHVLSNADDRQDGGFERLRARPFTRRIRRGVAVPLALPSAVRAGPHHSAPATLLAWSYGWRYRAAPALNMLLVVDVRRLIALGSARSFRRPTWLPRNVLRLHSQHAVFPRLPLVAPALFGAFLPQANNDTAGCGYA